MPSLVVKASQALSIGASTVTAWVTGETSAAQPGALSSPIAIAVMQCKALENLMSCPFKVWFTSVHATLWIIVSAAQTIGLLTWLGPLRTVGKQTVEVIPKLGDRRVKRLEA